MAKQVRDVYGNALFEVALEENRVDGYLSEAQGIITAIDENPDLIQMMTHPQISEEEKASVLESIFRGRVSEEIYALLDMILRKGHFSDVKDVFSDFVDRVKEYRRIGVVYVSTPMELPAAQRSALEDKLLETTDYVTLEPHYDVDPALIGGMVIRIGDRVVVSIRL